ISLLTGTGGHINIGDMANAVTQNINIGANATASSTSNVTIGSTVGGTVALQSASTINVGTNSQNKTINIGVTGSTNNNTNVNIATSTAGTQTVTIGSTNGSSATTIQSGTGNIALNSGGTIELQDSTNVSGSLQVTGGNITHTATQADSQGFELVTFPPASPGTWTTGGNTNWARNTVEFQEGSASAASGTIGNSQTSYLDVDYTFANAGLLKFYWKVSSEKDFDHLVVCVDDDASCSRTSGYYSRISGEEGWTEVSISLAAGSHSIRWLYGKDSALNAGDDKGFVDNIRFYSGGKLTGDHIVANYLGVGTTVPTSTLDVVGNGLFRGDSQTALQVQNASQTSTTLAVNTVDGRVGIGIANPLTTLHLWGPGTNGSGSQIFFGDAGFGTNAFVGEKGSGDTDQLQLTGRLGVYIATGNPAVDNVVVDGDGTTTFKNTTDATSAFQVLNAGSGSLFNIDSANSMASILGLNAGDLGDWNTDTGDPLTSARYGAFSVTANGYLYVIGGNNSSNAATNTVYYTKLNADGSVSTWNEDTDASLPNRLRGGAVAANGYVYVIGGTNGATAQSTAYYAKINSDGTLGTWNATTSIFGGQARQYPQVAAANGYVYVIGGHDGTSSHTTVYYAKINSDGTLGTWASDSDTLPAVRYYGATVVANGRIYIVGGHGVADAVESNTYHAPLNGDGSIGAWSDDTTDLLPSGRVGAAAAVANGYMYVIGGSNGGVYHSTVYYAKLNGNGTVGAWVTDTGDPLPGNRSAVASVIANGYIYIVGGYSGSAESTVYYSSTSRLQIGASLDLVGLQGQNLADGGDTVRGSTGGSITAGNGTFVGGLQVQGESNLAGSLSVNGAVTFQNSNDTNGAFSVLNAGSVPVFHIDTSTSRVYIGNPTADSTGALLVLDAKDTSGDPASTIEGSMYYNAVTKTPRCYFDGKWRNCNDAGSLSLGYNFTEDFMTNGAASDMGANGWDGEQIGTGASVDNITTTFSGRPGIVELTTGTTTTGRASIHISVDGGGNWEPIIISGGDEIEFAINIPTLSDVSGGTNEYDIRAGLCDNSSGDCVDGVYFEYNRDTSANWIIGASSNTTNRSETTTSTAVATGWHRFKMVVNSSASSIEYFIDGVSVGTISTAANLPTTRATSPMFHIIKEAGATARTIMIDYIQIRNTFTTRR
ncbi:MAG TPA: hypothetical protein VJ836_05755, partial [Candidatus Saccharimonadales bacterium]|nr:hypothetical protein [Candidatus Saccharimonadales bacterium]